MEVLCCIADLSFSHGEGENGGFAVAASHSGRGRHCWSKPDIGSRRYEAVKKGVCLEYGAGVGGSEVIWRRGWREGNVMVVLATRLWRQWSKVNDMVVSCIMEAGSSMVQRWWQRDAS